ncbi:MAG: hypothetical protein PHY43_00610 [Verrucomicrobiales bacterium]|nr:hypothetical protein [Verrucomicrobiales bacterium]
MKLRDDQTFMSLYFEPNAVEIATGEADSFLSAASWERNTKQVWSGILASIRERRA